MGDTPEAGANEKSGRLDLSAAQVAGSAVAAVGAAVLASKMGVYGTILGAGVVSVVATAGGALVQHLFHRTGEQLREATAQSRPKERAAGRDEAPADRLPPPGVYGEPTLHGTRVRGWKRSVLAAGAIFVLAMGAITGVEMWSGGPVSNVWGGDSGGTTLGNSVHSSTSKSTRDPAPAPTPARSGTPSEGPSGEPTPSPHTSAPPTPSPGGDGARGPGGTPTPPGGTDPSAGTDTPAPAPSPSGGGTPSQRQEPGGQGQDRNGGTGE